MIKNLTNKFLLGMAVSLALAACATDDVVKTGSSTSAIETCTPGEEACDYGCYEQHGPSTNDCIVQCNAAGTDFVTIQDCGWAQNWPYSSSCLDSRPHPICQFN